MSNFFLKVILIVQIIIIVVIIFFFIVSINFRRQENSEIEIVMEENYSNVDKLEYENKYKNQYYERLLNDKDFYERIMREKLGYSAPGDTVYKFKDSRLVEISGDGAPAFVDLTKDVEKPKEQHESPKAWWSQILDGKTSKKTSSKETEKLEQSLDKNIETLSVQKKETQDKETSSFIIEDEAEESKSENGIVFIGEIGQAKDTSESETQAKAQSDEAKKQIAQKENISSTKVKTKNQEAIEAAIKISEANRLKTGNR